MTLILKEIFTLWHLNQFKLFNIRNEEAQKENWNRILYWFSITFLHALHCIALHCILKNLPIQELIVQRHRWN